MLELVNVNQEVLNTKERITIDLLREGEEFLLRFDINQDLLLDTTSIVYRYLKITKKIPHNLYKFFIGAYFIATRHPQAFPAHESKEQFCEKFDFPVSSLEYTVERITNTLDIARISDDLNFPYYIDIRTDLGFNLAKNVVKTHVQKEMMKFLLYERPLNSQILAEGLTSKIIFELKIFPEEMFRQAYELIVKLVDCELKDYNEYACLQEKYFI